MVIEHEQDKLKNAVIYFLKNTKYCGNTKLAKLLYYLDFLHFKEVGKSVTGLNYYAYPRGPYPEEFMQQLNNKALPYLIQEPKEGTQFIAMTPTEPFNNEWFSKREITILERVVYIFKDTKAQDMAEATHLRSHPWDTTIKTKGENQIIDYFLALDDDSPLKDKKDMIKEDIADSEALIRFFNNEGQSVAASSVPAT